LGVFRGVQIVKPIKPHLFFERRLVRKECNSVVNHHDTRAELHTRSAISEYRPSYRVLPVAARAK